MLWAGSIGTLQRFMSMLDSNSYNLKFTMDYSNTSISFLDVKLSINSDGTISMPLYRKPIAGNTILQKSSVHLHSLVQSIPFSQYLQLRRNFSSEEAFKHEAYLLYNRLLTRGYSETCLKKAFKKAQGKSRDEILFRKPMPKNSEMVRFITTFSDQHGCICQIMKKHWHLLLADSIF